MATASKTAVVRVVAERRSVVNEDGAFGPGSDVLLSADEAARLESIGFLVPETATDTTTTTATASIDGATVTVSDGPTITTASS